MFVCTCVIVCMCEDFYLCLAVCPVLTVFVCVIQGDQSSVFPAAVSAAAGGSHRNTVKGVCSNDEEATV